MYVHALVIKYIEGHHDSVVFTIMTVVAYKIVVRCSASRCSSED